MCHKITEAKKRHTKEIDTMKKRLFVSFAIVTAALSLNACGETTVSEIGEDGKVTSSYSIPADQIMDYDSTQYHSEDADTQGGTEDAGTSGLDGSVYYEIDDRERKSVVADANDYESGNSSDSEEEMFAEIGGTLMNAFGSTYSVLDDCGYDSLYTMDAMPSVYGLENYSMHANEILLMQQTGSERLGENDVCIGAYGWLSRVFTFEHEWWASITDFTNALRETYPDCTSLQFTDRSIIPSAPSNISNTLGYVEFTAPFCLESARVRLYIEAANTDNLADSSASSDTWVYLCRI